MCLVNSLDKNVTSLGIFVLPGISQPLQSPLQPLWWNFCFRSISKFYSSHWIAGFPFLILLILFSRNPGSMWLAQCSWPPALSVCPWILRLTAQLSHSGGSALSQRQSDCAVELPTTSALIDSKDCAPNLSRISLKPQEKEWRDKMHCEFRDECISWSSEN